MNIVILAAGMGKRMHSQLPKVLQPLAGRPMLDYVLEAVEAFAAVKTIVVGHCAEEVKQHCANREDVQFALQMPQQGTGHALMQAWPLLDKSEDRTLVCLGDVPLLSTDTVRRMQEEAKTSEFVLLTVNMDNPKGYGRIVRNADGGVTAIVEEKDATDKERLIREVNTGIMLLPTARLDTWLAALRNDNAQQEYYLTDLVGFAAAEGVRISTVQPGHAYEVEGVNSKVQLAALERTWQRVQADRLLEAGVTLIDPDRIDVRVGPYSRLRPGAELKGNNHIGNFVEVKKAVIGRDSKVNHLTYIGDADVGERVNVGAGTITCNYDGVNKFRTVIGDDAFIGSDTQLIAPIEVGAGATIGAGTTLTKDAPAGKLTLSRPHQITVENWKRPIKK